MLLCHFRNLETAEKEKRKNNVVSSELDKRCDELRQQLADMEKEFLEYKDAVEKRFREVQEAVSVVCSFPWSIYKQENDRF